MTVFYDKEKNAQELLATLEEMGEDITFINVVETETGIEILGREEKTEDNTSTDPEPLPDPPVDPPTPEEPLTYLKAKLGTYTRMEAGTTNLSLKEFNFTGVMSFPNRLSMETLKGEYFTKDLVPNKVFMLNATTENAYSDNIASISYVECNKKVSIGYLTEKTVDYTDIKVLEPIFEDVLCYWTENLSLQKETDIGTLQKNVITITIPACYPITTKDFIGIKYFDRPDKTSTEVTLVDKIYNIQSIDYSFINTLDEHSYYGFFVAEVTEEI